VAFVGLAFQDMINQIPGMHVTFAETLKNIASDMHDLADTQWKDAMGELAKPPPSEGITKWFEDVTAKSKAAAEAIVGNVQPALLGDVTGKEKLPKHAAAMDLGSKEARTTLLNFQSGGAGNDPQKELLGVNKQQLGMTGKVVEAVNAVGQAIRQLAPKQAADGDAKVPLLGGVS
jgi:hypothetical protein